jgi:hypothetical protein
MNPMYEKDPNGKNTQFTVYFEDRGSTKTLEISNGRWVLELKKYNNGVTAASLYINRKPFNLTDKKDERVADILGTLKGICNYGTPCQIPDPWKKELENLLKK